MDTVQLDTVKIVSDPGLLPDPGQTPAVDAFRSERVTLDRAMRITPFRILEPRLSPRLNLVSVTRSSIAASGQTTTITSMYEDGAQRWVAFTQFGIKPTTCFVLDALEETRVGDHPAAISRKAHTVPAKPEMLTLFWEQDGSLVQARSNGISKEELSAIAASLA